MLSNKPLVQTIGSLVAGVVDRRHTNGGVTTKTVLDTSARTLKGLASHDYNRTAENARSLAKDSAILAVTTMADQGLTKLNRTFRLPSGPLEAASMYTQYAVTSVWRGESKGKDEDATHSAMDLVAIGMSVKRKDGLGAAVGALTMAVDHTLEVKSRMERLRALEAREATSSPSSHDAYNDARRWKETAMSSSQLNRAKSVSPTKTG